MNNGSEDIGNLSDKEADSDKDVGKTSLDVNKEVLKTKKKKKSRKKQKSNENHAPAKVIFKIRNLCSCSVI